MNAVAELPLPQLAEARNSSQAEADAIARTLEGDVHAFNELVVKYQQLAFGVAYRILHSKEEAADVVQESFVKAFRSLTTFKGGSFKSWLTRIVINSCYDLIRINRRLILEELADDPIFELPSESTESSTRQIADGHETPVAFVERLELRARIELGLRILPEEQRLVLTLCDIHGYSYDQICEITGMPMGTIKSRISRARLKLRDFLLQQPELLPAGYFA